MTRLRGPMSAATPPDDFLSGTSGQVWGIRATTTAIVADALEAARRLAPAGADRGCGVPRARWPRRRVLALAIERDDMPNLLAAARAELAALPPRGHASRVLPPATGASSRTSTRCSPNTRRPATTGCWCLTTTSRSRPASSTRSCSSPSGSACASPSPPTAQRSHAAWQVTRRRSRSVARETAFVEIGPVFAFHGGRVRRLLPFPDLRVGWGLDPHWSAVARSAWLADRRRSTPPRSATGCAGSPPRMTAGGDRGGARFSPTARITTAAEAQQTVAPRTARWTMRVLVVAEYYPRAADPVLGVWAHRQARGRTRRGGRAQSARPAPPAAAAGRAQRP